MATAVWMRWVVLIAALVGSVLMARRADAVPPACREWRQEHTEWKAEALRRYLSGAPQERLDAAVFELLQRETWLTSCDVSVAGVRAELVGWRLVGRAPEEYGAAVVDSVLEGGGLRRGPRAWLPAARR